MKIVTFEKQHIGEVQAIAILREEGIARLGVDHETANPTALAAWGKYFTNYTDTLVRCMDECAAYPKEEF